MIIPNPLRPAVLVLVAAAVASCDLLPGAARVASEQALADSSAVFGDTAGSYQPETPSRRRRPSRTPSARARTTGALAEPDAGADSAPLPPPPTAADRARATMSLDLRRLADAQDEHLANEGRYSARLSRLGLRYIPHAGVGVQLTSGDGQGWSAVATHESFPDEQCAIWVGTADPEIVAVAPAEGIPGCRRR